MTEKELTAGAPADGAAQPEEQSYKQRLHALSVDEWHAVIAAITAQANSCSLAAGQYWHRLAKKLAAGAPADGAGPQEK